MFRSRAKAKIDGERRIAYKSRGLFYSHVAYWQPLMRFVMGRTLFVQGELAWQPYTPARLTSKIL